jgi:hypothetical protein
MRARRSPDAVSPIAVPKEPRRAALAQPLERQHHVTEQLANFVFVEPEGEYGPAPFGRHSACTIC